MSECFDTRKEDKYNEGHRAASSFTIRN